MGREPGSILKDKHAQNANNTLLVISEQHSRICSVFTASSSQNALSLTLSSFLQQSLFPLGGKGAAESRFVLISTKHAQECSLRLGAVRPFFIVFAYVLSEWTNKSWKSHRKCI